MTYLVAQSVTGTAQLHVVGALVYGTGGTDTDDGDTDTSVLGFSGGVLGRAFVVEGFGLDRGVAIDYAKTSMEYSGDESRSQGAIQLIGFLGATFVI